MSRKRLIFTFLVWAVVCAALYPLRHHWPALSATLGKIPPWVLVASLLCCVLQIVFMAWRVYLYSSVTAHPPRFSWLFEAISYGQVVNALLPARSGDAVKLLTLKKHGSNLFNFAGALVLERLLDIVALLVWVALSGVLPWVVREWITPHIHWEWAPWFLLAAGVAGAVIYCFRTLLTKGWNAIRDGMEAVNDSKIVGSTFLISLIAWGSETLALNLLAGAIGHPISFRETMLIVAALNLAVAIPVAPGNIGSFEAAIAAALRLSDFSWDQGVAVGLTYHACQLGAVFICAALAKIFVRPSPPSLEATQLPTFA